MLGGSLGAIMLHSPLVVFVHAMRLISWVFKPPLLPFDQSIQRLVRWNDVARREGRLGLETLIGDEPDLFIRRGMQMLVDGYEPESIRATMEIDMLSKEKLDIQGGSKGI